MDELTGAVLRTELHASTRRIRPSRAMPFKPSAVFACSGVAISTNPNCLPCAIRAPRTSPQCEKSCASCVVVTLCVRLPTCTWVLTDAASSGLSSGVCAGDGTSVGAAPLCGTAPGTTPGTGTALGLDAAGMPLKKTG